MCVFEGAVRIGACGLEKNSKEGNLSKGEVTSDDECFLLQMKLGFI